MTNAKTKPVIRKGTAGKTTTVKSKPVAKKEEKAEAVDRTAPSTIASATFYIGKAPYNPRAAHNIASWEAMCKHLIKGGDKGASGAVLAKELVVNGKHPDRTHYDFVSYLERRGALARKPA